MGKIGLGMEEEKVVVVSDADPVKRRDVVVVPVEEIEKEFEAKSLALSDEFFEVGLQEFLDGQKKNRHRIILKDDDASLLFISGRKFAIMSPITYVGRNNTQENARSCRMSFSR